MHRSLSFSPIEYLKEIRLFPRCEEYSIRHLFFVFFLSTMNECHRLGIKNFRSVRHPGQIKLAFDLALDDPFATRHISSKGGAPYPVTRDDTISKFHVMPVRSLPNDGSTRWQWLKVLVNFICLICRLLRVVLQHTIYVVGYLCQLVFCVIFRILILLKLIYSNFARGRSWRCYRCHRCCLSWKGRERIGLKVR